MDFLKLLFAPQGSLKRVAFFEALIYSLFFLMAGLIIWIILMFMIMGNFLIQYANADHAALMQAMTKFAQTKPMTFKIYEFIFSYLSPAYGLLLLLAFLWIQLCAMLKRLVDLKLSRWLALIPYLSIGVVILYSSFGFNASLAGKVCVLVIFLFMLFLLFTPSQQNKPQSN